MVEHGQINLRVPDEAREPLKAIADTIRRDHTFLARLKRFLEEDDGERSAFLVERLDRLEKRVSAIEAGQVGAISAPMRSIQPKQDDMFGRETAPAVPAGGPVMATGEGKGRRLTTAGYDELRRRVALGETNAEIAAALGIVPNSVSRARKALKPSP